ncbi:myosin light chain kinase, smooth muscle isoform X1 [Poecilia latipinna]|uniref:myosin light chain kinase, smooth muscle isoform X1 n=1 Tax=Poecilia latipinna TaxID=48699 RepID=UPI00072DB004|nr:PREDICTED: myosin light chain kinase, smooth muscle-like isoform X1 [Poecilia latipinna]XP_014896334.1 PREDICTED: myosin light chain kinase, smooth muscle-like isoform X1 [Poecilia latipinna]
MNGDRSKQRYVSTFKLQLQPSRPSCAQKNGTRTTDIRTSGKCSEPDSSKNLHPPVFIKPLEDCCVDEGSDLVLRGVLTGSQPIKVTWLHNGERVRFGNSSLNGHDVSFVVRECLPEDAGAYTCLVENGAGRTSCSAAVFVKDFESMYGVTKIPTSAFKSTVQNGQSSQTSKAELHKSNGSICTSPVTFVQQSPVSSPKAVIPKKRTNSTGPVLSFQNPPQHFEVKVGQTANLTCFFTGSPPVVSCWIRNKEQIVDGPELRTEHTEQSSTLVIAEATAQHTGRYTVVVKDRKSSAQHTLTLSVIDRPEPPASGPVASLLSPSNLVLSWSGPCYDGGSAVLGYVLELRDQGLSEAGKWKKLTAKCASTSYQVSSGLQPGQEYCFRVRAYNAVGESDPSPVSAVVKMEESDSKKTQEEAIQYSCVTIDSSHKVTDHYNLHEKLGTGKFGLVFKLTHKETGHVCAGKFYKGRRAKEREAARKEIELMNHLHHPKLVQCLGAYDHKPEMVMVMEFIAGGELFDRIVDDSFEYTEPGSVRCIQQILEGIAFMHQQKIVHLDLKPENIVCVDTTGTCIKIVDFGLACKLDGNTAVKVMHGTAEFVAPEVISYEPVCLATDMWSIGVICYILLSGESPFQGNSDAETLALVTAAQWEFDEESFQDITEEAQHFISSLLNKDPRRRMSCEEGLAHPWMKKFDSENLSSTKCLSKEKMKRFLARQKWKKAGKAMLALKRMALLSKNESSASLPSTGKDLPLSPEAEDALESLERKMQGPPQFTKKPEDQKVARGSCARLSCHLSGYPDPEVVWLCGDEPVEESSTVQIEYDDDGHCTLILSKVKAEDANVYTCRATNDHGEIFCTAKLTVL